MEKRNVQTGLGLKKSLGSDSKIAKNVLESTGEGYCSVSPLHTRGLWLKTDMVSQPSGPIENTLCAYETIESLNKELYPTLHDLVTSDFFRHYKVDLFRECPFWYENGFCMNRDCGVETADEVSPTIIDDRIQLNLDSAIGPHSREVADKGAESGACDR